MNIQIALKLFLLKMATRKRSGLTPVQIANALKPFVVADGRKFLRFAEDEHIKTMKVDRDQILAMAHIVVPLREIDNTLSLRKRVAHEAMDILAEVCEDRLRLLPDHRNSWIEVMSNRLRNLCACIGHAEARPSPPGWVQQLPWKASVAQTAGEPHIESNYFFSWNAEIELAVRKDPDDRLVEEVSMPIKIEDCDHDDSHPTAVWKDGTTWTVPTITFGDLRRRSQRRPQKRQGLWEGSHCVSHHALFLEQRCDRSLLVSLYEQRRQILSLRASLMGPLPEPQPACVANDDPTIRKCVDFLVPICEDYQAGRIESTAALKEVRDKKLRDMNISFRGTTAAASILKKPAEPKHVHVDESPQKMSRVRIHQKSKAACVAPPNVESQDAPHVTGPQAHGSSSSSQPFVCMYEQMPQQSLAESAAARLQQLGVEDTPPVL